MLFTAITFRVDDTGGPGGHVNNFFHRIPLVAASVLTNNLCKIVQFVSYMETRAYQDLMVYLSLPLFIRGKLGTSKIDCGEKI